MNIFELREFRRAKIYLALANMHSYKIHALTVNLLTLKTQQMYLICNKGFSYLQIRIHTQTPSTKSLI